MKKIDQLALRVLALEKQYDGDIWLDAQDIYQWLHISKRTLQYWRDTAMIPYTKVGVLCWYKKSDILAFLESNKEYRPKGQLSKRWAGVVRVATDKPIIYDPDGNK